MVAASLPAFSAHIVGGDLYYKCLGNDNYEITLKIYRDCFASGPNVAYFDEPAFIGIYNQGVMIELASIFLDNIPSNVPPEINNPCLQPPSHVCVEEGTYTFTRNLPPIAGGYDIVYQRCCRNNTILNLIDPDETGATYSTKIPDQNLAACNSSPAFVDFPPIVICAGEQLVFDHSAVDPDGDVLLYSFCTPFSGASQDTPQINPPLPPPFNFVNWLSPYNANNPLTATPPLSIDPNTGILTGTPLSQGQYVVGVCVQEYRNGTLIGTTRRDFQFNVVECISDVQAIVPVIDTNGAAATGTAGVFVRICDGFDIQFINNSINGETYFWDFGVDQLSSDTSLLFEPLYVYPDTGVYTATLIVNPGYPCADTTAVLVRIFPVFDTDFDFVSACSNEPVLFNDLTSTSFGMINSWSWNFGDGSASSDQHPQHTYAIGGNYTVNLVSTSDKGCQDIATKNVTVFPAPRAAFDFDPVCINNPVSFRDLTNISSGNIASWEWTVDNNLLSTQQNPGTVFSNLSLHIVKLKVTSDLGCVDSFDTGIVVNPLPTVEVHPDTAICIGKEVQLFATGGVNYSWQPATGLDDPNIATPVASPSNHTTYTITVTDINSCKNNDSVEIIVNPLPQTSAGQDTFICFPNSYQLKGSGGVSFSWSPGTAVSDSTSPTPTIQLDSTTTFTLTSFNIHGCQNTDDITIEVQHPVEAGISDDQDICIGDTVVLEAYGGKYYEWQPAGGATDNRGAGYAVHPEADSRYQVTVSNDCFEDTFSVAVAVHQVPEVEAGENDSIRRDEYTVLNGRGSGIEYFWSPSAGLEALEDLNTMASPFNTTDYVLTMISEYGCSARDTMTLFVEVVDLLLIPNAFSPNNDGINDLYSIVKYLNVDKLIEFKIFNRWGNIIFEANDINDSWDGTYGDEPQGIGTYVYLIRLANKDGQLIEKAGTVNLIK